MFIAFTSFSAQAQFKNEIPILGAGVAYTDQQCLRQYRTTSTIKLIEGNCFLDHKPFGRCQKLTPNWVDLHTLNSQMCLKVFSDYARNVSAPNFKVTDKYTITQWRENYAYNLVRNKAFIKSIDDLEKHELTVLGKRATSRFE